MVAERNLAIFKVRYDSLQKAHAAAKNEILKMKVNSRAFLSTLNSCIYALVHVCHGGMHYCVLAC